MKKIKILISIVATRLFRVKKDTSVIPPGEYCCCYVQRSMSSLGCRVYVCPYFRNYDDDRSACLYLGLISDDPVFVDMCKICDINY
jgi:hypothetical protein